MRRTQSSLHSKIAIIVAAIAGLCASGCASPAFLAGGGFMPSADGISGHKASLGFMAKQCDLSEPPTGHFTYIDHYANPQPGGVKMAGSLIEAAACASSSNDTIDPSCFTCDTFFASAGISYSSNAIVYAVNVNYDSLNQSFPGNGAALACVVDSGNGLSATQDAAGIEVSSGPFLGYKVAGNLTGNIRSNSCPTN